MFGKKRPEDRHESGSTADFVLTSIFDGGIELVFTVFKFVGHAVAALLAGVFHL